MSTFTTHIVRIKRQDYAYGKFAPHTYYLQKHDGFPVDEVDSRQGATHFFEFLSAVNAVAEYRDQFGGNEIRGKSEFEIEQIVTQSQTVRKVDSDGKVTYNSHLVSDAGID